MSGWMQLAGIGMSMLSSYKGNEQKAEQIEKTNRAKRLQYENNKDITEDMLSTLDTRTDRAEAEAVRASVRQKMQIRKAQHKAEGEATVRAAHIGSEGTRASLATFRPSERIAGDLETDANINLQTELTNITEHYNSVADRAIANLNNSAPVLGEVPETSEMLIQAASTGLDYWSGMSDASKAELGSLSFRSNSAASLGQTAGRGSFQKQTSGVGAGSGAAL